MSALATHPMQLSVTSAKQKHWQRQAFDAAPRSSPGRRARFSKSTALKNKEAHFSAEPAQLQIIEVRSTQLTAQFLAFQDTPAASMQAVPTNKLFSAHATTAAAELSGTGQYAGARTPAQTST
eukprot:1157860-Pelagomonas_calceolata.AAC.4